MKISKKKIKKLINLESIKKNPLSLILKKKFQNFKKKQIPKIKSSNN